jgi:sulfhydrogenase subunit delta
MNTQARPRLAVEKFASCDGCQLALLCLGEDLLTLASVVDVASFPEARSRIAPGPYDITIVEGSISTEADAERIRRTRAATKTLVAVGACATAGGIQALRNWLTMEDCSGAVYPQPEEIRALATSTPISDHVGVDFELSGCPVDRHQLLEVVASLVKGRIPRLPSHSVCIDCKRKGLTCVIVTRDLPCLGAVTRAGCNALCPTFDRACYGCFGPSELARPERLAEILRTRRHSAADLERHFKGVSGWAPPFRDVATKMRGLS